jgi:hypothetical protein
VIIRSARLLAKCLVGALLVSMLAAGFVLWPHWAAPLEWAADRVHDEVEATLRAHDEFGEIWTRIREAESILLVPQPDGDECDRTADLRPILLRALTPERVVRDIFDRSVLQQNCAALSDVESYTAVVTESYVVLRNDEDIVLRVLYLREAGGIFLEYDGELFWITNLEQIALRDCL